MTHDVEIDRFDLSKHTFTVEWDEENKRYWLVVKRKETKKR